MSDVANHPIRFILSDMDGTLLLPDHSLSQRTVDAVRALREAGVLFSLASGRPPKAMLHLIETLGVDLPVAGLQWRHDLINPDGSMLVAHYLPADGGAGRPGDCSPISRTWQAWVFADGDWLRRDPPGPMVTARS